MLRMTTKYLTDQVYSIDKQAALEGNQSRGTLTQHHFDQVMFASERGSRLSRREARIGMQFEDQEEFASKEG